MNTETRKTDGHAEGANHRQLGFLGVDQYGHKYHIQKNPRKELLEQLGRSHAEKMYCDTTNGKTRHKGYVIAGLWIDVYRVCAWKEADE